jgi:acyl-homoserine-lactone acylase
MKSLLASMLLVLSASAPTLAQTPVEGELAKWERQAANITIYRDDWGIAHVYGRTDADAVFGVVFAQAEDDFNRVETNFINSQGRLAEAEGEAEVWRDLRMKLFIDPDDMSAKYEASPAWLKSLMDAWADGLNYYLATHSKVTPRVIRRFEPWMALTFSEGSIGGDIERINLAQLEAFYGQGPDGRRDAFAGVSSPSVYEEPTGSNGVAIAPSHSATKHALFLINPHTSFFFRSEAQMVSEEGLNAYGALTWGQFFVYQGFNERAGWMHTSSGVDNIDEYAETIARKGDGYVYRYGAEERPVVTKTITVRVKTPTGMSSREFTVYRTHHGPVVRQADGKWVTVRLMEDPVKALIQSYTRTKAKTYEAFRQSMELHTNSSNNTVYADADGTIAYFHSNFIPRRNPAINWLAPVDGSNPGTEWGPVMSIDETPGLKNPSSGWLYNANNWPWSAAGPASPKRSDYPPYVDRGVEETPRGKHALRVFADKTDFTLDSLLAAAFDSYLPSFGELVPLLLQAYDAVPGGDPRKARVADQIAALRAWDLRWSASSVATSLAVYWGDEVSRRVAADAAAAGVSTDTFIVRHAPAEPMLDALAAASDKLQADFGDWKTPWGDINRFQRITGDLVQPFNDAAPSIPVPFTSSRWGSLASFGARSYPNTKKMYGNTGNSFVAVVEFGDRVRARAVTAGGESGNPASPHFADQAGRYASGNLREVYFYREQLNGHVEREYHPGR